MTVLVAVSRDEPADGPLPLAAMIARSAQEDVVVATVVPMPWSPGPGKVDAEYQMFLRDSAMEVLEWARERMPEDITADYRVVYSRSSGAGLVELAEELEASIIVVGSSAGGAYGHVGLGSVNDRLLHTSPVPVAVAPRGHRCAVTSTVSRVTVAYSGTAQTDDLVLDAARVAQRLDVDIRIVSFAVRPRTAYTAGVGMTSEDSVVDEWALGVAEAAAQVVARAREAGTVHLQESVDVEIGRGTTWADAIDHVPWVDGDVLVVGSSASGVMSRVFLGSRATKILRSSPVPVVVVPRPARRR